MVMWSVLLRALVPLELLELEVLDAKRFSSAMMGPRDDGEDLGVGQVIGPED